MSPIMRTIVKDIIVLSAQAVAFRLAAPQDQQQDVIFAAVPTKDQRSRLCPAMISHRRGKVGF